MSGTGYVSEVRLWVRVAPPCPSYFLHKTEADVISREERNEEEVFEQEVWYSPLKMGCEPTREEV